MIRSSHHGLMNCSIASGDLDSALVHGWNVLRLCIAPESRAEALMNMAEICRLTGEHDAAIRVYAVAMEWTSHRGLRLNALSGALYCAVATRRVDDARRYLVEIDEMWPHVLDFYTLADVGVEISESLYNLGDADTARVRLASAVALAKSHAFHEVIHRAERIASRWESAPPSDDRTAPEPLRRRVRRSQSFRMVLRSLNGLASSTL
jgi:tetratricopeptide (TPR) repeat protein